MASLPFALRNAVNNVMKLPDNIQEIHLRVNKPIVLYSPDNRYFITENFKLTADYQSNLIKVTKPDINETFSNICNFSVYSKQNEIVNGFITLYGGNRAGICGTALNKEGIIYNIRDITADKRHIALRCKTSVYIAERLTGNFVQIVRCPKFSPEIQMPCLVLQCNSFVSAFAMHKHGERRERKHYMFRRAAEHPQIIIVCW